MRAPHPRALGFLSARATEADASGGDDLRPVYSFGRPAPRETRSRRATRECLFALAAVDAMLEDGGASRDAIAGERTALLYTTAACYAASNRSFIEGGGGIHFAYTAPAVVPAEVAIEFGVTGPYAIFLGGPPATLRAIWQAALMLESGACDRALVLAAEIFEECGDLFARARRLVGRPLVEAAACLWLEPGQGRLVFESSRVDGPRSRATGADDAEMLGCGPLAALDRWRRGGEKAPLELAGAWRGEQACLRWDQDRTSSAANAHERGEPVSELHGRCGR